MKCHAYLSFDGNCEEALRFYEEALGAKMVNMMHFAGTPMAEHAPPDWHTKILHACITIGESMAMASDSMPGQYEKPAGTAMMPAPATVAESERIFAALSEGGTVTMPLAETFWTSRFGAVTDRFGTPMDAELRRSAGRVTAGGFNPARRRRRWWPCSTASRA